MIEQYDFHFGNSIITLSQEAINYAQKDQANLLQLLSNIFHELNDLDGYTSKRITLTVQPIISRKWEDL